MIETTPTILDKQQERKEIMLEINALKAEKEVVKKELSELTAAKTALNHEFKEKIGVDDLKNAVLENIINNRLKYNIDKYEKNLDILKDKEIITDKKVKDLKKSLASVSEKLEKKTGEFEVLSKEFNILAESHRAFLKSSASEKETILSEIKELRAEKEAEKAKLDGYKAEFLAQKTFISKEEIRLSNKSADLHIYEARLRKKFLELMPEMEIVV